MSIVKMKRIRLIALAEDRDALVSGLLHAGCVQVSEPSEYQGEIDEAALLHRDTAAVAQAQGQLTVLQQALGVLDRFAPGKGGLFAGREQVEEAALWDADALRSTLLLAESVNDKAKQLGQLTARETRLHADQMALAPWAAYELPLEEKETKYVSILLGTVPNAVDFETMAGAVQEAAEACEVRLLSADREQKYLEILVHSSARRAALEVLRTYGFSFSQLKDLTGTVSHNIQLLDEQLRETSEQYRQVQADLSSMGGYRKELQLSADRVRQILAAESAKEKLLTGGSILYLDGWLEAPEEPKLKALLEKFDCAYELEEPSPEEYPRVPVKLKNNLFTRCMNTITEMYSLPAYDGVDPNPLMAPFFILFFGVMMADMAYGLLMIVASAFYLKKAKPKNPSFMEMIFWCGISTFLVGALTGGFFGDFIPQLLTIINPASTFEMPALLSPLDDIVMIMIGSLVLGVIQIFTGMGISVYKKVKDGDFLDALFGEITWWIILGGLALWVCGMMLSGLPSFFGSAGKALLIIGALMLVFGGTRNARGFGKVTSLVGLVYNGVTGYFSDILSYIRLMALMVSGSVIASVFNTLGATFGNVILFVIISMVGNALNLALNLLGCYVHDLRLQCLEFFGRFYKEGGKPYQPLTIQTKYVDVIKEET